MPRGGERPRCSVDGCDNAHLARGFCGKHYYRWRKFGEAEPSAVQAQRPVQVGERFGRLEVIAAAGIADCGKRKFLCRCDCGTEVEVEGHNLRGGRSTSCGRKCRRKHGHCIGDKQSPTHAAWNSLIQRTTNPNNPGWDNYGGRGIAVCERWRNSFEAFLEDMGERPAENLSIDRIDNDGGYEPSNCRWTDAATQQRNRRRPKRQAVSQAA